MQEINCRACQTRQFISLGAAEAEPIYDRGTINEALFYILNGQNRWRYYLARNIATSPSRLTIAGMGPPVA